MTQVKKNESFIDNVAPFMMTLNNQSQMSNLYGQLFALKDTELYILKEIARIEEELEKLKEEVNWKEL